ncbi:MAG: 16S rRNA (adenine(1518)-N(6)/adenine(1519)-N(6))-dimethyltransferase RsmA [Bryobacteraceae bacterium]
MGQRLGQHFLAATSILKRIAEAACAPGEPLVVEIGPGKGALTEHLLARAQRVAAIELDPALVGALHSRFPSHPKLTLIQGDALRIALDQWGPATFAGNLPYYAATPIIERVVRLHPTVRGAVFLIQKEVAERLVAVPGTRQYGYLTVATRLFADARILFDVRPGAFQPPPKVDSSVIRLVPRNRIEELRLPDADAFLRFLQQCFRQKRKTLRNNLGPIYGKDALEKLPESSQRAEQVTLDRFAAIYLGLVG